MEDYFTILPNILFYNKIDEATLYQEVKNYKLLLVMDYLHMGVNRHNTTRLSIKSIVTNYGYKSDSHKGKINEQIVNMLKFLNSKDIIKGDFDINKVSISELIECVYNGIDKDENDNYINFTMIDYNMFNRILYQKKEKVDNIALLFYYCYLCSRVHTREGNYGVENGGGMPEICYPSYNTISKDIYLSQSTISKYNQLLINLDAIRIGNLGLYYIGNNKKFVRESPNFYALVKQEDSKLSDEKTTSWHINLKEGMKYYKKIHKDYTFLDTREYKDNNKKVNGYISRITQLEKQDKATKKQIKKRDNLLNEKEDNKQNIKEEC